MPLKRPGTLLAAAAAAAAVAVAAVATVALAASGRDAGPSGIHLTPLSEGTIGASVHAHAGGIGINTRGPKEMLVTAITVDPHGSFGWHTHPGPVLVAISKGTLTVLTAHGHGCRRSTVSAGDAFIEAAATSTSCATTAPPRSSSTRRSSRPRARSSSCRQRRRPRAAATSRFATVWAGPRAAARATAAARRTRSRPRQSSCRPSTCPPAAPRPRAGAKTRPRPSGRDRPRRRGGTHGAGRARAEAVLRACERHPALVVGSDGDVARDARLVRAAPKPRRRLWPRPHSAQPAQEDHAQRRRPGRQPNLEAPHTHTQSAEHRSVHEALVGAGSRSCAARHALPSHFAPTPYRKPILTNGTPLPLSGREQAPR